MRKKNVSIKEAVKTAKKIASSIVVIAVAAGLLLVPEICLDHMKSTLSFTGLVYSGSGKAVQNAKIAVSIGDGKSSGKSDAKGKFSFSGRYTGSDLGNKTMNVKASAPGFVPLALSFDSPGSYNFGTLNMAKSGKKSGTVKGVIALKNGGKGLFGVSAELHRGLGDLAEYDTYQSTETDRNGEYTFLNVPPGYYTLRIRDRDYSLKEEQSVSVSSGLTTECRPVAAQEKQKYEYIPYPVWIPYSHE